MIIKNVWNVDNWFFKDIFINSVNSEIDNGDKIPLSSVQKAIWINEKIYPNSSINNVGGYAIYNIPIDFEIFTKVIERIINEDVALCLEFEEEGMDVFQHIRRNHEYYISICEENHTKEEILEFINNDISKKIDFQNQMFELKLFKVHDSQFVIYLKVNHIVFDGYSSNIFQQKISKFYEDIMRNEISKEICINKSYFDFVDDNIKYINSNKYVDDRSFWKEFFVNTDDKAFENIIDKSDSGSILANRKTYKMSRDIFEKIEEFCKSKNITIYQYFIAAIYTLNELYGNRTFTLGLPILNRSSRRYKETIGAFISVLPFRLSINEFSTFEEILTNVKRSLQKCYRHRRYPIADLMEEIESKGLLYNICFSYQRTEYSIEMNGCSIDTEYISNRAQQEDIIIHLIEDVENKSDITIYCDYKCSSVKEYVVDNLMQHLINLASKLYKESNIELNNIDYMLDSEKLQIINDYNNTNACYPSDKCIHELFEEEVKKYPNNVAAIFKDKSLTYRELNDKSDKLAEYLINRNVKINTLVGVCMERSLEMIISIVAILKAGAAYVPLDIEYPKDRLNYMIEDSNVSIILTQSKFINEIQKNDVEFIELDLKMNEIENKNINVSLNKVSPDNWAYMIYTSGSTGNPKGVINTHNGLVNRINWMQKEFKLKKDDVVLQKTPFSFDVSIWEFTWALTVGATIVLAEPGGHRNPEYLIDTICKNKVTTIHFVPSMLQVFMEQEDVTRCTSLKRIVCSGEELKVDVQNDCLSKLNVELYNLYGPTEAAIDVSYYKCKIDESLKRVPIGKPIDNTKLLIVNRNLKLLPIGVSGELHILGQGLAVGYYNKQDLTEQKFIPSPYKIDGYDRMYKTGDLARLLPDGNIEYLGRIDNQVKINGLRIELDEIEVNLKKFEGIKEAVVIARNINSIKNLVAFVVLQKGFELSQNLAKVFLRQKLPEYMIPKIFVVLDSIPLSHNGKVDVKKLSNVEIKDININEKYVEPTTEVEKLLVNLFEKVLKVDKVGIDDNYFNLGGDSIKCIQIIGEIKKHNFVLSVEEIFKYPTIRELSRQLNKLKIEPPCNSKKVRFSLMSEEDRKKLLGS